MSQIIFDTINPNTTSGTALASILDDFKNAVVSGFSGTSRPANLQQHGYWIDTTNVLSNLVDYKYYNGTTDITLFTINIQTAALIISAFSDEINVSKSSDDTVGAKFILTKKRSTGNQTQIGDILGELHFESTDAGNVNYLSARIKTLSLDATTASEYGADLVFETVAQDAASLNERMRLTGDGKLGVGSAAPDSKLHISGAGTVSKTESVEDSVNSAQVVIRKKRATGTGASQDNDVIGQYMFTSTDENGAEIEVGKIEVLASENHSTTNQGSELLFHVKNAGGNTFTQHLFLGEGKVRAIDLESDGQLLLNKGGNDASSENKGLEVERTGTNAKIEHQDALTSKFAAGAVGDLRELATISHAQKLTNKEIDFELATNARRLVLPKESGANLDTLTDKEALFAYNTTIAKPVFNDGASWLALGGATVLNELGDVSNATPSEGQGLFYNGSNFVNTAPYLENLIINGDMQVSQRGDFDSAPVSTSSSVYSVDRMRSFADTVTATIQRISTSQPSALEGSKSLKIAATSTATGSIGIRQFVENDSTWAGKTFTMGVWVKSNNANARATIYDGTGFNTFSSPHSGGGGWEFLKVTETLVSGIGNMQCFVKLCDGAGANVSVTSGDYIEITGFTTYRGSIAFPFIQRPYLEEFNKCLRFYESGYMFMNTGTATSGYLVARGDYSVIKRTTPTVTYKDNAGNAGKITGRAGNTGSYNNVNATAVGSTVDSIEVQLDGINTYAGFSLQYFADADF